MNLSHTLDRRVTIQAPRETVFSFFTDDARWASWWGPGSTIEPGVGGRVYIRHPGNVEASGEVLEILPPGGIVFSYGFNSGSPFPPGGSRVTIALEPSGSATLLSLRHEFPDEVSRDHHVQGWRFQLSLLANAVSDLVHAGAAAAVDEWFDLWTQPDEAARMATLGQIATADVSFHDRYSLIDGAQELSTHIAAAQKFMPGIVLKRRGAVRQCQGLVIVDWIATGPDQAPRGQGSNVFRFGPDGRITAVTGFWG
ncbi:MAG TPA: SRPBCC domain-containing protein [Vicinamibacterales bacterium]|nr:SRPBCC domain-containing protein [Vicinamibacterales bacterium]